MMDKGKSDRIGQYKSRGLLQTDELRRRREDAAVEIRKQKREENLAKRRNFLNQDFSDDSDDDYEIETPYAEEVIVLLFTYINFCLINYKKKKKRNHINKNLYFIFIIFYCFFILYLIIASTITRND